MGLNYSFLHNGNAIELLAAEIAAIEDTIKELRDAADKATGQVVNYNRQVGDLVEVMRRLVEQQEILKRARTHTEEAA